MLLTAKYVVQKGTVSMHMDVYGRRCSYVLFELYMMSEFVPFVCAIRSLFLYLSGPWGVLMHLQPVWLVVNDGVLQGICSPSRKKMYFEFVCLAHFLPVLRHLFYRSHDINRNNKTCNIFTIYKFANFAVKLHNMIQQGQVCSTIPPISFMNSFELCCMHSVKTIDYGWQKTCWNRWLLQCTDSDMESVRCSGLDTLFPLGKKSGALRWRVENCWVSICLDPSF